MLTEAEILALSLAADQPQTFELTQSFWRHRYQVDPTGWLVNFERAGLLQIAVAPELSLQQQTVTKLKILLRAHDLKISGRKAVLIARLQMELPAAELAAHFPQQFYQLTSAGAELVAQNHYVRWIHDHYVAGIVDFTAAKRAKLPKDLDLVATLTWLLDAAQAQIDSDWPQYYYIEHLRFQFAWQNQRVGTALNALLDCIRLKLAGLSQTEKKTVTSLDLATTAYKVEPFYSYMLQRIMQDYSLEVTDVMAAFVQRCELLQVPYQLFSDQEMQQLLQWTLTGQNKLIQQCYQHKQKQLREVSA